MKNKSHKRVKFTRINPLSISFAVLLGLIWCCTPGQYDDVYVAEPEVIKEVVQATSTVLTKKDIEEKIKQYFPRSWRDMIPTAYAESGLNHNAQNWNCWYNDDKSIVYT